MRHKLINRASHFTPLLIFLLGITSVTPLAFEGYGCREANLPNGLRVECLPNNRDCTEDKDACHEMECRNLGCVWCDAEGDDASIPKCFHLNKIYESRGPECDIGFVQPSERVSCPPGETVPGEQECRLKGCTWCRSMPNSTFPSCFQPSAPNVVNTFYEINGAPQYGEDFVRVNLRKTFVDNKPQFEGEAMTLVFEAYFQSDNRLRIKISPPGQARFEVPLEVFPPPTDSVTGNQLYEIQVSETKIFSFKVIRKSTGTVLFDSSAGRLVFADQFISMSWFLPTENVYGLGENEQRSFKHDFKEDLKYRLFAMDQPPFQTASLYGTQPHYTVLENGGNAHAVAIVNSNAQEFHVQPGPALKFNTIGGILDMYFFLGPTPEDTVHQYTQAVGVSQMPAYWALGFQLCRYGYDSIENMKRAVDRTEQYGIPHDVQYGDIDIMYNELDFTYNNVTFNGLPEYILELKEKGIHFVTILDPFIAINETGYRAFDLGQEMDVWYKRANGIDPVVGRVWPYNQQAPVYFPDYSKNSTKQWWMILIEEFHDLLAYDGLWIDMNEPANFDHGDSEEGCLVNRWNNPPYLPGLSGQELFDKTICLDHVDSVSIHYNTHSLYGWFQSEPTLTGTRRGTGKRSQVLSRSTFLGSGRWVSHWLGDNWSLWSNLHFSIIGIMQFNLWGIPHTGADICGFIWDSNAELCQRWMELGAFYPFSRNHNGKNYVEQDPGVWGAEVAASSKAALEIRYTLLPYLYTLFYHHVTNGGAVFRPLWYNYPKDLETYGIDRQFMWGSGVLITPVLDMGHLNVTGYFPAERHYDYNTGLEESVREGMVTLEAPMNHIPVHLVGGNVIPTQEPARNTVASRKNPFGFIVALNDEGVAQGNLFYDDGDTIDTHLGGQYFYGEYAFEGDTFSGSVVTDGYSEMDSKIVKTVRLLGFKGPVAMITVDGVQHNDFELLESGEILVKNLSIQSNKSFSIKFLSEAITDAASTNTIFSIGLLVCLGLTRLV